MTKPTHQVFSVLVTAGALITERKLGYEISPLTAIGTFAVASIACLLPDADQPNSWAGRHLFLLCLPLRILRWIVRLLAGLTRSKALKEMSSELGHRKLLHYPATHILFAGIAYFASRTAYGAPLPFWVVTCVFGGYTCGAFSHIIGDTAFGGLALLEPLTSVKIRLTPFPTGGAAETIALVLISFADLAVLMPAIGLSI